MSQYTEAFDSLCGDCAGINMMSLDESDIQACIDTMRQQDPEFNDACGDADYLGELLADAVRGLSEYQDRERTQ